MIQKKTFIFIGIVFIILIIFHTFYINKEGDKSYIEFYNTNINGQLSEMDYDVTGVHFRIKNDPKLYTFKSYRVNTSENFYDLAGEGDTVLKPSGADTLKLLKNEKTYLFTFYKFVE